MMQRYMCEHRCGNDIDAETSAYMYDAHAYTYADECAAAYFHACSMHTHTHTYIHTHIHTHIYRSNYVNIFIYVVRTAVAKKHRISTHADTYICTYVHI